MVHPFEGIYKGSVTCVFSHSEYMCMCRPLGLHYDLKKKLIKKCIFTNTTR